MLETEGKEREGPETFLEEMVSLEAGVDVGSSELGWRAWRFREGDGVGSSMHE